MPRRAACRLARVEAVAVGEAAAAPSAWAEHQADRRHAHDRAHGRREQGDADLQARRHREQELDDGTRRPASSRPPCAKWDGDKLVITTKSRVRTRDGRIDPDLVAGGRRPHGRRRPAAAVRPSASTRRAKRSRRLVEEPRAGVTPGPLAFVPASRDSSRSKARSSSDTRQSADRVAQVRRQLRQRTEHEEALAKSRMRHLQPGLVDDLVAEQHQIEIQGSRRARRRPASVPNSASMRSNAVQEIAQRRARSRRPATALR